MSSIDPEVTSVNIRDHLKEQGICNTEVVRLRTKYDSYASFHIEVDDSIFDELFNVDIWPAGSLVTQFFGRLKSENIFHSEPKLLTLKQAEDSKLNAVVNGKQVVNRRYR